MVSEQLKKTQRMLKSQKMENFELRKHVDSLRQAIDRVREQLNNLTPGYIYKNSLNELKNALKTQEVKEK